MTEHYYFPSGDIYVFPCANRGNGADAGAYTTEYNLTHLAKLSDTYIVTAPTGASRWVQCFVKGYFFRFEIPNTSEENWYNQDEIYFQICLSDNTTASNVAMQSKLVNFEAGTGTNESLDIEDELRVARFKAARLTKSPASNSYYLQLRSNSTWLPAFQSIKTSMIADEAVTTDKIADNAITYKKLCNVWPNDLASNLIDTKQSSVNTSGVMTNLRVQLTSGGNNKIGIKMDGDTVPHAQAVLPGDAWTVDGALYVQKQDGGSYRAFVHNGTGTVAAASPLAYKSEIPDIPTNKINIAESSGIKSYTLSLSGNVLTLTKV